MRKKALLMISSLLLMIFGTCANFGTYANIPTVDASASVTVAAGSSNGYVNVYDEAGALLWSYYTGAAVASVAVSSDGAFIAVGSLENKLYLFTRGGIKLWEKTIPIAFGGTLDGKESKSVVISAHGEYIVAGCTDNLYVYRKTGVLLWSHAGKETCVDISPSGDYIVSCNNEDKTIDFFSILSSTPLWTTERWGAFWVATSDLGYVIVGCMFAEEIFMFNNAGTELWSYTLDNTGYVRVDMPCDGLTAVAVNHDLSGGACYLWYFDLNGLVWKYTPYPPENDFHSVAISEDGNIISMGPGNIGGIYIYSSDGTPLQTMPLSLSVQSVDLTSDGQFGAFGDCNLGTIWFFSKDSNTPLWSKTLGGSVHAVSIAYCETQPYDVAMNAYCCIEALPVSVGITLDGSPTGYSTPHTFENETGTHTFTAASTDVNGHPFYKWNTGQTSTTITVTSAGTYTAYYYAGLTINAPSLPPGHEGHTPLLDTGFWLNTGTFVSPVWTYYPWGSTIFAPTGTPNEFDIKVPFVIRDSYDHGFQITSWPGYTVISDPEAEPAHGGIAIPTRRWRLDSGLPLGPAPATVTPIAKRAGPQIDVLRGNVITGSAARLTAMTTGQADVWSSSSSPMDLFRHQLAETGNLMNPTDITTLMGAGFTLTYDAAFHMGHIGFNIRPLAEQHHEDGSPRRPDTTIWPLADVAFRHALFHCYDQDTIVASIYGFTATPVQSLVPYAQGGWVNPAVPKHPYNPGNPFTSPAGEHSSCGILKAAGYVFVDAAPTGVGPEDYWTKGAGGPKMPKMTLWTPTLADVPASFNHGAMFVADLGGIGLEATFANGFSGFTQVGAFFADYMDKVDAAEFDAYMAFWDVHRFPDHLYDMCHSSQICGPEPDEKGRGNKPGINDALIDAAVNTIKTSLNHAAKLQACYEAQDLLYDETRPDALAYMQLCSKIHFNVFDPDLRGILESPGSGSDNYWTYMNIHWAPGSAGEAAHTNPDGTHFINWIEGEAPERLNPCYASTVYAWDVMSKTMDGLLMVNPYTHEDLPWLCSQLPTIVQVGDHMEITFHIRNDVFWQDGNIYTAYDAKFNWDFLKNNAIPRYTTTWMFIDHVDVTDTYTVKVTTNVMSQFLVYDLAGTAALLPPNVWESFDGTGLFNILAYDPSADTSAAGMGPWFGTSMGPSTRLFGTGPFVFDYWDPVGQVWEVHQFPGYFRITEDIHTQKVEMFHAVGDVDRDGEIWSDDQSTIGARYGAWWWHARYDPDADVNQDGKIDFLDIALVNFHFGELREYPEP